MFIWRKGGVVDVLGAQQAGVRRRPLVIVHMCERTNALEQPIFEIRAAGRLQPGIASQFCPGVLTTTQDVTQLNPGVLEECVKGHIALTVRARFPAIDFLLTPWQPMLEMSFQTGKALHFPFEEHENLMAVTPHLRWVQTTSAGVGQLVRNLGLQGSDVIVTRPRHVVIVSEHAEQYERLFHGLAQRYRITVPELLQRVHLFDAARLAAAEIPREVMHLLEQAGGSEPPLITLDTASASFDLKDENSNAEVGAMLAALKQPVTNTGAPLWIVAHAAKALGREDPEITPRGASAYIGDVHATGSVFRDKNFPDSTFIKSLKNRNERDYSEIEVRTDVQNFRSAPDERGRVQQVGIRLGVPFQSGEITRRQAAQDAKEAAESLSSGRHSKHVELLNELRRAEPGISDDLLRYRFYERIEGKQDTKQKAFKRAFEHLSKAVDNSKGGAL